MNYGSKFHLAQKALTKKIEKEGSIMDRRIVMVDRFLNQGLDIKLIGKIGKAFAEVFAEYHVNKVLTVEASGIPVAFATAQAMKNMAIYAKKNVDSNMTSQCLQSQVYSYTRQRYYPITIASYLLEPGDRVLLVDDFLARGEAMLGLLRMVKQAGAEVVGVAVAIEKSFEGGSQRIRSEGYKVCSLVDFNSLHGKICPRMAAKMEEKRKQQDEIRRLQDEELAKQKA